MLIILDDILIKISVESSNIIESFSNIKKILSSILDWFMFTAWEIFI